MFPKKDKCPVNLLSVVFRIFFLLKSILLLFRKIQTKGGELVWNLTNLEA